MLEATHLVAGGKGVPLKRTPKLLAGIGRCRFVVSVEWLHQSAEKRQILDGLEYVLCDAEVCDNSHDHWAATPPRMGALAWVHCGVCIASW